MELVVVSAVEAVEPVVDGAGEALALVDDGSLEEGVVIVAGATIHAASLKDISYLLVGCRETAV